MERLHLTVNNKIEIVWEKQLFKSNIQDVNEKNFGISIPTKDGEYIPLITGDLVEVVYYETLSIFEFDARVVGRKIDGIPIIILEKPTNYKVIQRRQFYRVEKLDYINFTNFGKYSELDDQKFSKSKKLVGSRHLLQKAVLLDLSGGGMRIKVDQKIDIGDTLDLVFNTLKGEIQIYGKVVRIERDGLKSHICGICFFDLTNLQREKIIQYTFEIMRAQRSKGL